MTTTNNRVRRRFEDGKRLNDGAPLNTTTDAPNNGADTVVPQDADAHIVTPDGTNSVDLDTAAEAGRLVIIVHDGGANTPTLSFAGADFVGTEPGDLTSAGDSVTVLNTDGETSGWIVS